MNKIKISLYTLLGLLVLIQVFRPEKNSNTNPDSNDISKTVNVPDDIKNVLKTACYDCHSNSTTYPWYSNVQPIAWWLADHVNEGKRELNFSIFNDYKMKRKIHKLEEIEEQLTEKEMPLFSYTIIHTNAKLSDVERNKLITWARESRLMLQQGAK